MKVLSTGYAFDGSQRIVLRAEDGTENSALQVLHAALPKEKIILKDWNAGVWAEALEEHHGLSDLVVRLEKYADLW